MAHKQHLQILKQGREKWNSWRKYNTEIEPDLSRANLRRQVLTSFNFNSSNFSGSDLTEAHLHKSVFVGANLTEANLHQANLHSTDLSNACFVRARLTHANLINTTTEAADFQNAQMNGSALKCANLMRTNLSGANLSGADLGEANLSHCVLANAKLDNARLDNANLNSADLTNSDFFNAYIGATLFCNNDLSLARNLHAVRPLGPSTIGLDTIYRSLGNIPKSFLIACDVPEGLITFVPSLIESDRPIQFHSCFISYSEKDELFAKQLYSHLRDANLKVWFAPENMKAGQRLYDQIDQAIQVHDKVLLVLSDDSMKSEWVKTEIRRARRDEIASNRQKLFPLRLVSFEKIKKWQCFDVDTGTDLALALRELHIPDFSNWIDRESFNNELSKLIASLGLRESMLHHA